MSFLNFVLLFFGIFWPLLYINTLVTEIVNAKLSVLSKEGRGNEYAAKVKLLSIIMTAMNWAIFICLRL